MNGRSEVFSTPLESGLFKLKAFLAFPILTLRQAQGERIGKAFFDRLPSSSPGRSRVNRPERRRPSSPGHMPLFESKMLYSTA
ncbi:MAG: hypothetical protein LBD67_02350 [Candidatus Accumulibacter sp.]|nr:hypothetical protein [Accumulibacter sp.]